MDHRDLIDRLNAGSKNIQPEHAEIPTCKEWKDFVKMRGYREWSVSVPITKIVNFLEGDKEIK